MDKTSVILLEFDFCLRKAYDQLYRDFIKMVRDEEENPILPDSDEVNSLIKKAVGRCGQRVGAGVKRAKIGLIVDYLQRQTELDITPTHAINICKRIIGRGISPSFLAEFSTPGRTAANKSKIKIADTAELEAVILVELKFLLIEIQGAKELAQYKWLHSERRSLILADMSDQARARGGSHDDF